MGITFLLLAILLTVAQYSPNCRVSNLLANATVPHPGLCPYVWTTNLSRPRGAEVVSNNDLLVVEAGNERVLVLWDEDGDGYSNSSERAVLANQTGLNHAVIVDSLAGYLYASNPTTVYRWNYTAGTRKDLGSPSPVVINLPCCHHITRGLRLSPDHTWLYVQSGSASNVDMNSTHAQIRRFNISELGTQVPIDWSTGELVAEGLRNTVGMRFDRFGRLWGGDNGVDELTTSEFGDIHNDNPCEELNLLYDEVNNITGKFYGYPYCWSEWLLPRGIGRGPGTQWLQSEFQGTNWTNARCKDRHQVMRPKKCFPAHNAPLDILFDNITTIINTTENTNLIAYMTFHGSWNRAIPDGYCVRQVMWDQHRHHITYLNFLAREGTSTGPGWIRPVGLGVILTPKFSRTLMISDDLNGQIIALGFDQTTGSQQPPPNCGF